MGQLIDKNGRRLDPAQTSALKNMLAPENVSSLNYYNVFVPNMDYLRALLNKLLKKDAKWVWTMKCQEALKKIKGMLTSDFFLTHYNPKKEIIVASVVSSYGIGTCIMHKLKDGLVKSIAHASRILLPAKKNYFMIEKESLGIVFSLKKNFIDSFTEEVLPYKWITDHC